MLERKKTTKAERMQFFLELKEKCLSEDAYSVIEIAEGMGTPYKQVKEWTDKNKQLKHILEECRVMCGANAYNADVPGSSLQRHSQLMEYILENDDKMRGEWDKSRAIKEAERKAKEQKEKELRADITFAVGRQVKDGSVESAAQNKTLVTQLQKNEAIVRDERLKKLQEKSALEGLGYSTVKNKSESTDDNIYLETSFNNSNLTDTEKNNLELANICAETGVASDVGKLILLQAIGGCFRERGADYIATTTQEALLAMKPADIHEGLLCSRLVVLHSQYMNFMSRVTNPDSPDKRIDLNINRATKLMRLYNETLEALNRYRRKGEQKVTVQHVNVDSGGQAIIASTINQGGNRKKTKE